MIVYIDTIAISTIINLTRSTLLANGWKYIHNSTNPITSYYQLYIDDANGINTVYLKYFHHQYLRQLTIQFNIRKLMTNSNNNSDPVHINHKSDIYDKIDSIIHPVIGSYMPMLNYSDFRNSRVDLAHNHIISEFQLDAFYDAVNTISMPRFHKHKYNATTTYFNSSPKKFGNSGIVIKLYNKTDEMLSKHFSKTESFYEIIDVIQEDLTKICDDQYLVSHYMGTEKFVKIRIEGASKSRKLNALLGKHNLNNTFENILEESIQLELLKEYIHKMHLDIPFQSKESVYKHIDRLYKNPKLNKLMKTVSYTITNKRHSQLQNILNYSDNDKWLARHIKILYDNGNGCRINYTKTADLEPVIIPALSVSTTSPAMNTPTK